MPGIPAIAVPCPPLNKKQRQGEAPPPVPTDFVSYWLQDQWVSQWV